MKKFIFLVVLSSALFGVGSRVLQAQEKRLASSPKIFQTFFADFKRAVEKNDRAAVAKMTAFPFRYGFDAGDEGKMSKTQFVKEFNRIFGENPKQFLNEKNPLFSRDGTDTYIVSTEDAAHLSFVKKGNGFKFISYIVEP